MGDKGRLVGLRTNIPERKFQLIWRGEREGLVKEGAQRGGGAYVGERGRSIKALESLEEGPQRKKQRKPVTYGEIKLPQ